MSEDGEVQTKATTRWIWFGVWLAAFGAAWAMLMAGDPAWWKPPAVCVVGLAFGVTFSYLEKRLRR